MPLIKIRPSSIIDSIDLRGTPTAPSAAQNTNSTQLASTAYVRTAVSDLVDSSPGLLDTLNELAAAINDDASFSTTVANSIALKLNVAGGTMTGALTLSGAPTVDLHAATKLYVDGQIASITINDTDDVPEGTTNLYFTSVRNRTGISLTSDNAGVLTYNNTTGIFTYNHPSSLGILEDTNLYYTDTRARAAISLTSADAAILAYSSATGVITFTMPDTDDVVEGATNLYHTVARARSAISAGSNIVYDSATGVVSTLAAVQSVNGATGVVVLDTDDVAEGATNQYFTNTRARGAISLTSDDQNAMSYSSGTGIITYVAPGTDAVDEGATNLYFTNTRARAAITLTTDDVAILTYSAGVFTFATPDTDKIDEGATNQYFTNTRARNAVSAAQTSGDGTFSYDNTTGVFTLVGTDDADYRGAVSALRASGDGDLQYDSATGVFTYTGPSATNTRAHFSAATSGTGHGGLTYAAGVYTYAKVTASNIRGEMSATDAGGDGSFAYDNTTGVMTYTGPSAAEARAHFSAATSGAGSLVYDNATGVFTYTGPSASSVLTQLSAATSGSGHGGLTYDSATGVFTYAKVTAANVRGELSHVDAGGDGSFAYDNATGVMTYTGPSAAEARAHISHVDAGGDGSLSYDAATGVITYTGPSATEARAHFSAATSGSGHGDLTYAAGVYTYAKVTSANIRGELVGGTGVTYTSGTGTIEIGQAVGTASNVTFNDVTVSGDLTVSGTLTAINSTNVEIEDKNLILAKGSANAAAANGAGLTIDGPTVQPTLLYANATDSWNFNKDVAITGGLSLTTSLTAPTFTGDLTGNVTGNVTGTTSDISNHTTTALAEGTNLYFTNTRARLAVSATDAGGDGSFAYDNTTGVMTYTGPSAAEARLHVSATDAGGDGSFVYDNTTGVMTYTGPSAAEARVHVSATTSGTGHGGLSYDNGTGAFTFAKVTASNIRGEVSANKVSGDGNFSYDSATGVFSYTGPSSTESRLHLSATDAGGDGSFAYDNTTGVFTYTGPSATEARAHFSAATSGSGHGDLTYAAGVYTYAKVTSANIRGEMSATTATGATYDSATGVIALAAIPNASLTNSAVTVNSLPVSLGASITLDTDDVAEGGTNQYFTNTRARSAISLTTSNAGVLAYDSATGVLTFNLAAQDTDDIAEGATNLYFTTVRARGAVSAGSNISYDSATGVISSLAAVQSVNGATGVVSLDTDDITEGATNLYFTNTRARAAITLTTDDVTILTYSAGVFTFVTPDTDAIDEGAVNLYYTNTRADDRIAAASIRDLSDVDSVAALQDGYTLVYSSTEGKFVPQNIATSSTTVNFTGNGSTTSFSTGVEVASIDNTQVFVNGLVQTPTYSYTLSTVSNVTSIVFDGAPETNDLIFIRVTALSGLTASGVLNENSSLDGGTF